MGSMLATGLSFVVFFLALGLTFLISDYIIAVVLDILPVPADPEWAAQQVQIHDMVKLVMLLILPATFTFAVFKLLINASYRGKD